MKEITTVSLSGMESYVQSFYDLSSSLAPILGTLWLVGVIAGIIAVCVKWWKGLRAPLFRFTVSLGSLIETIVSVGRVPPDKRQ